MKKDSYYQELEKEGYYETIDKRSKDYREYKQWLDKSKSYESFKENVDSQPEGLGDTVASITKATGIDKLVKFVAGEDCGCEERKELMNKKFKYRGVKCLSENDYNYLTDFFEKNTVKAPHVDQLRLTSIHNYVFGTRKVLSSCRSCFAKTVKNIKKYLQVYN